MPARGKHLDWESASVSGCSGLITITWSYLFENLGDRALIREGQLTTWNNYSSSPYIGEQICSGNLPPFCIFKVTHIVIIAQFPVDSVRVWHDHSNLIFMQWHLQYLTPNSILIWQFNNWWQTIIIVILFWVENQSYFIDLKISFVAL